MTTIKIRFKPTTLSYSAFRIIRTVKSKVVVLKDNAVMIEIDIANLEYIEKLRGSDHIQSVSLYKNEVETIRGLFDNGD